MIKRDDLKGLRLDKCSEDYSIRIPEVLKKHLDNLPAHSKASLKEELLLVMAKMVHENNFNPEMYLSTQD